jgi:hypothetical protein
VLQNPDGSWSMSDLLLSSVGVTPASAAPIIRRCSLNTTPHTTPSTELVNTILATMIALKFLRNTHNADSWAENQVSISVQNLCSGKDTDVATRSEQSM